MTAERFWFVFEKIAISVLMMACTSGVGYIRDMSKNLTELNTKMAIVLLRGDYQDARITALEAKNK